MLHELLRTWFGWVEHWGYLGIFVLMAMESSIIPVPSEVVMAPAAFWAAQGKMNFALVVLTGTAGSYVGSAINYWVSYAVGMPLFRRYGKLMLLSPSKIKLAEDWVARYGVGGVFLARLLPVVRHLISIPAGALRMNFGVFSLATVTGAGLWCWVLSWFGEKAIGQNPEVLQSPEAMARVIRAKLAWFLAAALALTVLYGFVIVFKRRQRR